MVKPFRRFAIITVSAVIFLIFVGAFVRATGSGMGCPDWPTCFGMWIPPTSVDQLPINYQEIYGAKLKGEIEFNATKTWIEYVNRLVGVTVGILIFISLILSYLAYFKKDRSIFYICIISFLLVSFQGWLGAKVVYTELHPGMITLHMVVAVLILGLLIWAILRSYKDTEFVKGQVVDIRFLLLLVLITTVGQIVFGTQIREGIDVIKHTLGEENRELWIDAVKGKVVFHTIISLGILVLHWLIYKKIYGRFNNTVIRKYAIWGLLIVIVSIISGGILRFAGFPALMQPFHLTFATVLISIQFVLYFILNPNTNRK